MQPLVIAALAAFGAALVALALYHFALVAPALSRAQAALTSHDQLIGGGSGANGRLTSIEAAQVALAAEKERVQARLRELEGAARSDISAVGFVRYNAFDDTGSELSYAVALLNREGDGVVLSSIYSRTDTRTFGKAVSRYKPLQDASVEELSAIQKARLQEPS
ncbi:MAG: DUF4446 family protein [Candidatus Eremiobacteraeota bacterium]|nr:DUF4446 family protein [Candidatus Eremiobacteraeota bacterium]